MNELIEHKTQDLKFFQDSNDRLRNDNQNLHEQLQNSLNANALFKSKRLQDIQELSSSVINARLVF